MAAAAHMQRTDAERIDGGFLGVRCADMHCHLDFMLNADEVARDAAARGMGMLAVTVTPDSYARLAERPAVCDAPFIRPAVGWHPWWVPADAAHLADGFDCFDRACGLQVARSGDGVLRVGEIGLDYAPGRIACAPCQQAVFEHALSRLAAHGSAVASIHCVRAYDDALDIIERTGAPDAGTACIFHWFSGTSDQLNRAIRMGCLFSVSERMLASKKGRAYVRAMPLSRIVLETDAPQGGSEFERGLPSEGALPAGASSAGMSSAETSQGACRPVSFADLDHSLDRTLSLISELRHEDAAPSIAATSSALLGPATAAAVRSAGYPDALR